MIWIYAATLFATFNVCMLLALTYIWVTSYRRFRTAITLGFLCFGIVLLVENLFAIYFFFGTDEFYTTVAAQQMVLVLRLLESIALICLSWVIVR